jgi:tetratricopeptide (TPR) repeat protein
VGATFGIIVFLLYCALHIWILIKALRILNSRDSSINYLKGIALIWILTLSQSLLSIEIIGLGVMNWLLGAILLSASLPSQVEPPSPAKTSVPRKVEKTLPVWVGSLTIASFTIGVIPAVAISIEDKAFTNIAYIQVDSDESKAFVKENFGKLSDLSLLDSYKFTNIINNLFQAGLNQEIQETLTRLHTLNPKDPYAVDMFSSYYQNMNQIDEEILAYRKFLNLDPLNYQMELFLASAYARKKDIVNLEETIERIRVLAPVSQEYLDAKSLLTQATTTP